MSKSDESALTLASPADAKAKPKKKTQLTRGRSLQLDLFQTFLNNKPEELAGLSNALDFWDSIPRYSLSQQAMSKLRDERGFLNNLELNFRYRGCAMHVSIQAALIKDSDGVTRAYYPSGTEELIEEALRKLAADKWNGNFDAKKEAYGVYFTIYELREELYKRGHGRTFEEIFKSLQILSGSLMILSGDLPRSNNRAIARSNFFPLLVGVTKQDLSVDPSAKWYVQFHPLASEDITTLRFRQFNYDRLMRGSGSLTRWLIRLITLKFTQASQLVTWETRYTTIKTDSSLLEGFARKRAAQKYLRDCFQELVELELLTAYTTEEILGPRGKVTDIIFKLTPHQKFAAEARAANKRLLDAEKALSAKQRESFS